MPTHTGRSGGAKRKRGPQGKSGAKSDGLERVVREDAGVVAMGELTREERADAARTHRWERGETCEMPAGHGSLFVPIEGRAFVPEGPDRVRPPTFGDVCQGNLADAWLLAAFAAVARMQPERLVEAIREIQPGIFDVRLGAETIRVTAEFPSERYADPRPNDQDDTLWVALLEKAFALSEAGSYAHLECGNPGRALERLTGQLAHRIALTRHVDPAPVGAALREGFAAGRPMVVLTRDGELPPPLVGEHAYAVVGLEDDRVQLYNPWGPRGEQRPLEAVLHTVPLSTLLEDALALHFG